MPAFDLNKSVAKAKFTLEKKGIPNTRAAVVLNLDVSGSAEPLFASGQMQRAAESICPVAILLDDNANLDIFTFADHDRFTNKIGSGMTAANYSTYIKDNVLNGRIPLWGGTHYAQIIRANLEDLGFIKEVTAKGGLFSRGTTSKQLVSDNGSGYPALIITLTDGCNYDQPATLNILKQCQDAKVNAYFLFVGIGGADFSNIMQAGDLYSNVGFVACKNLENFVGSDDIYDQLLPQELVEWFKSTNKTGVTV